MPRRNGGDLTRHPECAVPVVQQFPLQQSCQLLVQPGTDMKRVGEEFIPGVLLDDIPQIHHQRQMMLLGCQTGCHQRKGSEGTAQDEVECLMLANPVSDFRHFPVFVGEQEIGQKREDPLELAQEFVLRCIIRHECDRIRIGQKGESLVVHRFGNHFNLPSGLFQVLA